MQKSVLHKWMQSSRPDRARRRWGLIGVHGCVLLHSCPPLTVGRTVSGGRRWPRGSSSGSLRAAISLPLFSSTLFLKQPCPPPPRGRTGNMFPCSFGKWPLHRNHCWSLIAMAKIAARPAVRKRGGVRRRAAGGCRHGNSRSRRAGRTDWAFEIRAPLGSTKDSFCFRQKLLAVFLLLTP